MDLQDTYKAGLNFAAVKHKDQKVPGTVFPYIVHVSSVAMEVIIAGFHTPGFDTEYAVTLAFLHDVLEDTDTTYDELSRIFSNRVAEGVLALTKFSNLEKTDQMSNSLQRIKDLEKEVWAVKLADRITNLEAPPLDWKEEKRKKYLDGASSILQQLGEANEYLAKRLEQKIKEYETYVATGTK